MSNVKFDSIAPCQSNSHRIAEQISFTKSKKTTSGYFSAEILAMSPRKLFNFIFWRNLFSIKVSKRHLISIWKQKHWLWHEVCSSFYSTFLLHSAQKNAFAWIFTSRTVETVAYVFSAHTDRCSCWVVCAS